MGVVEEQVCFDIQNELKKSINDDDAATRMDEITDTSIYDEDDDSLQVFEEGNDEIPKVEESYDSGYDDGNAQEVLVNNDADGLYVICVIYARAEVTAAL